MAFAPFGNFGQMEARGQVSGPIGDMAAVGIAAGVQQRDGYTTNAITGNDVDFRDGTFAKAQFMMLPNANWEAASSTPTSATATATTRSATSTRSASRRTAWRATSRASPTATSATPPNLRGTGENFAIEATTGSSPGTPRTPPISTTRRCRSPRAPTTNNDRQFTQEVRIASPENAPLAISDQMLLKWQAGVEYFNQAYEQLAINTLGAGVLSPQVLFPVRMYSPESAIDSQGIGLFDAAR